MNKIFFKKSTNISPLVIKNDKTDDWCVVSEQVLLILCTKYKDFTLQANQAQGHQKCEESEGCWSSLVKNDKYV